MEPRKLPEKDDTRDNQSLGHKRKNSVLATDTNIEAVSARLEIAESYFNDYLKNPLEKLASMVDEEDEELAGLFANEELAVVQLESVNSSPEEQQQSRKRQKTEKTFSPVKMEAEEKVVPLPKFNGPLGDFHIGSSLTKSKAGVFRPLPESSNHQSPKQQGSPSKVGSPRSAFMPSDTHLAGGFNFSIGEIMKPDFQGSQQEPQEEKKGNRL